MNIVGKGGDHEQPPPPPLKWIPDEIIMDILSRLPARRVVRFRRVSKHWCSLTRIPHFIDMHLRRAQRHTPSVLVEQRPEFSLSEFHLYCINDDDDDDHGGGGGSSILQAMTTIEKQERRRLSHPCNGLICLTGKNDIILVNLTTQESFTISKPSHMPDEPWVKLALAFQPSTSEYKLVWGHPIRDDCNRFELMTLGSSSSNNSSWRYIGTIYSWVMNRGLCVGGIVYYLINDREDKETVTGIVSLDLEDDKFREVALPLSTDCYESAYSYNLSELHGNLCLAHHCESEYFRLEFFNIDIWVLKDPANSLWVKEYRLLVPLLREESYLARKFLTVNNGKPLTILEDTRGHAVFAYTETLVTLENFV